jgi:hypothetical protein
MPIVGLSTAAVMSRASPSATPFDDDGKGAGVGGGLGLGITRSRSSSVRPLALNAPSVSTAWGRRPTWPMTGMPRWTR